MTNTSLRRPSTYADRMAGTTRFVPTCRGRDLYLGYLEFVRTLAPDELAAIRSEHGELLARAIRDINHPFWDSTWPTIEARLIDACNRALPDGKRFGQSDFDPTEIGVFDETDR